MELPASQRRDVAIKRSSKLVQIPPTVRRWTPDETDRILLREVGRALLQREQRSVQGTVRLTELELINYLLSLVDTTRNCPLLIESKDGTFLVNDEFRVYDDTFESSVQVYVSQFVEPHRQLKKLVAFSENTSFTSPTAIVLQQFVINFLKEHTIAMNRLYTDSSLRLRTLFLSVRNTLVPLSTVYDALCTVDDADTWDSEVVDRFLERFLCLMSFAEVQPLLVQGVVARLQEAIFPLLERYFDHIFLYGTVDPVFLDDFLFRDNNDDSLVVPLKTRQSCCSLWSDSFVEVVLQGAREARRLRGCPSNSECAFKFSSSFREILNEKRNSVGFVGRGDFCRSLKSAAQNCVKATSEQLFSFAVEGGGLNTVMSEIMKIYTGFAVREMAFDLFGATRDSKSCSIVSSFCNSLRLAGFTVESATKWKLRCDSGFLEQLEIRPELPWPLAYLVDEGVISILNECLRFLLKLIRASELLSRIRIDYPSVAKYDLSDRKFSHLLCLISHPLRTMAELLFSQLHLLMARKVPLVLSSKSVDESRGHLIQLSAELANIVKKSGARSLIHDAVTKLCRMSMELETRLAIGSLKEADLNDMLKAALREKQLLIGIGQSMEGTAFKALQLLLP